MARRLLPLLVLATVNLMGFVAVASQMDGRLTTVSVLLSGGLPPSLESRRDPGEWQGTAGGAASSPFIPAPDLAGARGN